MRSRTRGACSHLSGISELMKRELDCRVRGVAFPEAERGCRVLPAAGRSGTGVRDGEKKEGAREGG